MFPWNYKNVSFLFPLKKHCTVLIYIFLDVQKTKKMKSAKFLKLVFFTLLVACFSGSIFAQNGNIQGTVSDENGLSLPGANIVISDIDKGAISDFDGRFSLINVPAGVHTLTFTYLGYTDVEQEGMP